jgi:hypothetical protein
MGHLEFFLSINRLQFGLFSLLSLPSSLLIHYLHSIYYASRLELIAVVVEKPQMYFRLFVFQLPSRKRSGVSHSLRRSQQ